MKPIASKRFYFTIHERLFWSEAYQSLTPSAINLMMCFYAELRWSGKGKKRKILNNGEISFSEAEFKANGLGCSATYGKARDLLIKVGFIELIYRGGMARGDMNRYKLLWTQDVFRHEMRWQRYPHENWEQDIPKVKDYAVGRKTRFKKKNNTLQKHTLNGSKPPTKVDPIYANPPTKVGSN